MIESLTSLTPEYLESAFRDFKAILFSPRFHNRNALLSAFVEGQNTYFYSLTANEATLDTFVEGLIQALGEDNPGFGKQTTQALNVRRLDLSDLADALVNDLATLKPRAHLLVLDSFDFLEVTDDVSIFFQKFVEALPDETHLIVNARYLRSEPWQTLVHSGKAIVLGEDQALDGGILVPSADTKNPHLEVYALGKGNVYVNGNPVVEWDGPLPRHLFFYFMDHPMVTRDEIFEMFWPGVGQKEATNVFHVTKRKITERVGFEITAYSGGFYRPSKAMNLHYDVAYFENGIAEATGRDDASVDDWYRAIRFYRNAYLVTSTVPWVVERREQLRLHYANALIAIARLYNTMKDSDKAVYFYLRALNEVPDREDIYRDLMTLYQERGERDKALNQYDILQHRLYAAYRITPSEPTRELYAILSKE